MYCSSCQTELPDGAIRCWKCGAAQDAAAQAASPVWETCTIRLAQQTGFFSSGGNFLAEAQGPQGAHTIATTAQFAPPYREDNRDVAAALHGLLDQLDKEGWERVGEPMGDEWYAYRFRRRVR
jgi:hypothetical protein